MKCVSCGADFPSDQIKCPYCNAVNEHALELAKELQQYDKKYEQKREEMLNTGESLVLRKVTIGVGIAFLVILLALGSTFLFLNYRYGRNSKYQVTGARYIKNKKMVEEYMNNKEYIRAYILASSTDPTTEYFSYYPEYQKELLAIYNYSLILREIEFVMDDMDNGDNYRSFTPNQLISFSIFYGVEDSDVKAELQEELESYLRNLYRLTDAEIMELREAQYSTDFELDGDSDYEKVSKKRMVEYYGK